MELYSKAKHFFTLFTAFVGLSIIVGCKKHSSAQEPAEKDGMSFVIVKAKFNSEEGSDLRTQESDGTVNSEDPTDQPDRNGSTDENRVNKIRIVALKLNGQIQKNQVFTPSTNTSPIEMIVQLPVDSYRFLLIANEPSTATTALNNATSIDEVKAATRDVENKIYTPNDIASNGGIPMLAESNVIEIQKGGTETNPFIVNPELKLERTLAKVELYFKNIDAQKNIYGSAGSMKVEKIEFFRTNQRYNLYPTDASPLTANRFLYTNNSGQNLLGPINQSQSYSVKNVGNIITMNGTSAQKKDFGKTADVQFYMAPRPNTIDGTKVYFDIYLKNMAADRLYKYTIDLAQMNGTAKDYTVHRNRIYEFKATITGELEMDVWVKPWDVVDKDIDITSGDLVEN